jgi:integrase/recombinase XerC
MVGLLRDKTSAQSTKCKAPDSLGDVLEKFYLDQMVGERSSKTIQFYRDHFDAFIKRFPDLADRPFSDITVEHIEQHLLAKKGHPYAKSAAYRSLRALWYFALRRGIVKENIVKQIRSPKLPKDTTIPIVKKEDLDLLLATCGPTFLGQRDRAIMLTLYDTGLRLSELVAMAFSRLDIENMEIRVLGKGNKRRTVSFDESVRAALVHYIYNTKTRFKTDALWLTEEKTPIKGKGIQEMLARRSKTAGLPRIHPHMFRHSCAVNLLLNGMDIDSVMKYLGQETVTVLQGYLKSLKSENASELHKRFSPARHYFGQ